MAYQKILSKATPAATPVLRSIGSRETSLPRFKRATICSTRAKTTSASRSPVSPSPVSRGYGTLVSPPTPSTAQNVARKTNSTWTRWGLACDRHEQQRRLARQRRYAGQHSSTPDRPHWAPENLVVIGGNVEDAAETWDTLHSLLYTAASKWQVTADGLGVLRTFEFKSFKQAKQFITELLDEVAKRRHHPTITTTYNIVEVLWTTHRDPATGQAGFSLVDAQMAMLSNELADNVIKGAKR